MSRYEAIANQLHPRTKEFLTQWVEDAILGLAGPEAYEKVTRPNFSFETFLQNIMREFEEAPNLQQQLLNRLEFHEERISTDLRNRMNL